MLDTSVTFAHVRLFHFINAFFLNRREYNIVVRDQASNLFGYVFKFLRDEEDSKDIVQDVFEKFWKNRKKVEKDFAKAWLFKCAHNALINFSKRKGRITFNDAVVPERSTYDDQYETKQIVEKVLKHLPPVQKSIVLLRDLEGYSYKEIGEILEISDAKVKVYLFRARKKMKKRLKELTAFDEQTKY